MGRPPKNVKEEGAKITTELTNALMAMKKAAPKTECVLDFYTLKGNWFKRIIEMQRSLFDEIEIKYTPTELIYTGVDPRHVIMRVIMKSKDIHGELYSCQESGEAVINLTSYWSAFKHVVSQSIMRCYIAKDQRNKKMTIEMEKTKNSGITSVSIQLSTKEIQYKANKKKYDLIVDLDFGVFKSVCRELSGTDNEKNQIQIEYADKVLSFKAFNTMSDYVKKYPCTFKAEEAKKNSALVFIHRPGYTPDQADAPTAPPLLINETFNLKKLYSFSKCSSNASDLDRKDDKNSLYRETITFKLKNNAPLQVTYEVGTLATIEADFFPISAGKEMVASDGDEDEEEDDDEDYED